MKRIRILALAAALILLAATSALSLEVIDQTPAFRSKAVTKDAPLTVVFDQSLDPGTVTPASIFVAPVGGGPLVAGSLSLKQTHVPGDTVVFEPESLWRWARRYRLSVTDAVQSVSGERFTGALEDGGIFAANIPNDFAMPEYDPNDPFSMFTNATEQMGFNPLDPEGPAEPWEIPGMNVTDAWKYTTGNPEVIIALVDTGIDSYNYAQTRTALFLNRDELPLPNVDGEPCAQYDCNSDGRFNVEDYARDDRVESDGAVSAYDLIRTFSNDIDEDRNGLTDDISGWDFFRNANDAIGDHRLPLGNHGEWQMRQMVSRADDGVGEAPGACPDCTLLPIRASSGLLYEYSRVAAAVRYAMSMGARIITLAGVNTTWSARDHRAFQDAYDAGAIAFSVSGDEMNYHHWMPANGEDVIDVKAIFSIVPVDVADWLNMETFAFTETMCTGYGSHVHLAVPASGNCTSNATALITAAAGLLYSRAADLGIDLEADEAKQLLTMTAYDIRDHCYSVFTLFPGCQDGVDEHFGYGRPDLGAAMEALGDPDRGVEPAIPPVVRVTEPLWWQTIDPSVTPSFEVKGQIRSRRWPVFWRVQAARGHEPFEDEFRTVASGMAGEPIDGLIARVQAAQLFGTEDQPPPSVRTEYDVTLRVQASYEHPSRGTVRGEGRKTIGVHVDRDPQTGIAPGFPVDLGASGESSPVLYDLDGDPDQRLEIVLGTGAGEVVALKYDEREGAWKNMPGFPLDLSGADPWVHDSIYASVAVGDLLGDGTPEIVAATIGGSVYAIDPAAAATGDPLLPGFPVRADERDNETAYSYEHGPGFQSSPVLADLDLDGMLEIVAASLDLKVYAWKIRGDSGKAERLSGWPVLCKSVEGNVPEDKVCAQPKLGAVSILATPVAAILDPSSADPDIRDHPGIVVTTNETCGGEEGIRTRAYAIYHNGTDHPGGPFLPGWPARPPAPLSLIIPFAIGAGAAGSPAAIPAQDGIIVAMGISVLPPRLLFYLNGELWDREVAGVPGICVAGNPAVSSMTGDGRLHLVSALTGAIRLDEEGFHIIRGRVFASDLNQATETVLEGDLEDMTFFVSPVTADLEGDGTREAIVGSGGTMAHSYRMEGSESPGWPKYTQKWILAAPAVGDIDADGSIEVVIHTREGVLYAWESTGPACADGALNSDWRRFHHDERNTGVYGADTLPPSPIADLAAVRAGDGNVRLSFTAPGDDWTCGTASAYEIRYCDDPEADLCDVEQFESADLSQGEFVPAPGGSVEEFVLEAPGAQKVAVRSVDEEGNLSFISEAAVSEESGDDDVPEDSEGGGDDTACGCGE